MPSPLKSVSFCLATMACALPAALQAADNAAVTCSVTIDYERNNVLVERYTRDFVADPTTPFVDDFSTRIRSKAFSATVTRDSGITVVSFDYYNDVGVFHAIALNSSLTMRGSGDVQSTSGRHNFYATNSTTPASVGGTHLTAYNLACRRL